MIERIKQLIDCKAKSVREFASMVNVKQVTLNQQISGTRSVSLDVVMSILNSFENISAEWLLRGKGDMFISQNHTYSIDSYPQMASEPDNFVSAQEKISLLEKKIISLEAENNVLREVVGLQKKEEQRKGEIA